MKKICKVVVAHPFQQHSFKTARAIKEHGLLHSYITTVYLKNKGLTRIVTNYLEGDNKVRANGRKCPYLEDKEVITLNEVLGLLLLLIQRIAPRIYKSFANYVIDRFNKSLYNYVVTNDVDTVIVYDTVSAGFIKRVRDNNKNICIILDMSAPYWGYMGAQFLQDAEKHIETEGDLLNFVKSSEFEKKLKKCRYEVENSDLYLVASDVSKESLLFAGIDESKIKKCIYGIDDFSIKENKNKENKILRVVFVGNVTPQKGAYQLLRIAKLLPVENFRFEFYGNYNSNSNQIQNVSSNVIFYGHIPRTAISKAYTNADVLVFPSLCDGFGFVTAEALLCGIPVITSTNAGSKELIKEGVNGFVYDVHSDDQLMSILNELYNNRKLLATLKANARASVQEYTWDKYNKSIKIALNDKE